MELHRTLGLVEVHANAGTSTVQVIVPSGIQNAYGKSHAGVLYVFLDLACFAASLSLLRAHQTSSTVDASYSFLRATQPGDELTIIGSTRKLGRSLGFASSEAWMGQVLVAQAKFTQVVRSL